MKILLLCVTSDSVVGFRRNLIECLKAKDNQVSVVAFDDKRRADIEAMGCDFFCIDDSNRSLNPLKILSLKRKYKEIINRVSPDVVFTFMLKPNLYGTLAAKAAGVKRVFSMVEGAGDVFANNGLKWKLIRAYVCSQYKRAFRVANKVFFLNDDDENEFVSRKLVSRDKCEKIFGIGVDLERFDYRPLNNTVTFLMIARMLKTKGIIEYCEAAKVVKEKYPEAVFNYLGSEGTVKMGDLDEYTKSGIVNHLGTTNDVRPYLESSAVYVLPSYREGLSVSIMEAMATGRAIITTRTNGCRDMVVEGENGYTVPVASSEKLAQKMIWFLENQSEVERMGKASRAFAEKNFDQREINERIYTVISES